MRPNFISSRTFSPSPTYTTSLGPNSQANGAFPFRLSTLKSMRWMCTGWNQPPDLFSISHTSVSPRPGLASTFWKPESTTSCQVSPLRFHSLVVSSRCTRMLRTFIPAVSTSFITSLPASNVVGTTSAVGSFLSKASSTTSNAMILLVLSKSRLLGLDRFCSSMRCPVLNFEKSMRIS